MVSKREIKSKYEAISNPIEIAVDREGGALKQAPEINPPTTDVAKPPIVGSGVVNRYAEPLV